MTAAQLVGITSIVSEYSDDITTESWIEKLAERDNGWVDLIVHCRIPSGPPPHILAFRLSLAPAIMMNAKDTRQYIHSTMRGTIDYHTGRQS